MASNSWFRSGDGFRIPKSDNALRTKWDADYLARVKSYFGEDQEYVPVQVPVDRISGGHGVMSKNPRTAFYTRLYQQGEAVPPIVVAEEGDGWFNVLDGNHRIGSAIAAGKSHVPGLLVRKPKVAKKPRRESPHVFTGAGTKKLHSQAREPVPTDPWGKPIRKTENLSFQRGSMMKHPAFRHARTGEVVVSPGFHDTGLLAEHLGLPPNAPEMDPSFGRDWEDGFVDHHSRFYTREEAAKAVGVGQYGDVQPALESRLYREGQEQGIYKSEYSCDLDLSKNEREVPPKLPPRIARALWAIRQPGVLTDELRKPAYRSNPNRFAGHCFVATNALFHLIDGHVTGWKMMCIPREHLGDEDTHWFLRHTKTGHIIDPTSDQFDDEPIPYEKGVAKGTSQTGDYVGHPTKRAQVVIDRARDRMAEGPRQYLGTLEHDGQAWYIKPPLKKAEDAPDRMSLDEAHKLYDWFHLSYQEPDEEGTFQARPYIPSSAIKGEDVDTKRICVGPTIHHCLAGLEATSPAEAMAKPDVVARYRGVHVYGVPRRAKVVVPTAEQVPDAPLTGEGWLTKPTRLEHLGSLETGRHDFHGKLRPRSEYEEPYLTHEHDPIPGHNLGKAETKLSPGGLRFKSPDGRHEEWDYSHLLPEKARQEGYRVHLRLDHASPTQAGTINAGTQPQAMVFATKNQEGRSRPAGQLVGTWRGKEVRPWESLVDEKDRRKHLGQTMYEALYTHARAHLGATTVSGEYHSTSAHLVHKKLAARHGLDYEAKPNVGRMQAYRTMDEWRETPPHDSDARYGKYEYRLPDVAKVEDLAKGAMQRLAPFNPTKDRLDEQGESNLARWQGSDREREDRDAPAMPDNARTRALHKLHAATHVRRNPDNGEREFLLHRGVSPEEYVAVTSGQNITHPDVVRGTLPPEGFVNHENVSSWTPRYSLARTFALEYRAHDGAGWVPESEPGQTKYHVLSAWVPESAIGTVPEQMGKLDPDAPGAYVDDDEEYKPPQGANKYSGEHEVMVLGDHNSRLATPEEVAQATDKKLLPVGSRKPMWMRPGNEKYLKPDVLKDPYATSFGKAELSTDAEPLMKMATFNKPRTVYRIENDEGVGPYVDTETEAPPPKFSNRVLPEGVSTTYFYPDLFHPSTDFESEEYRPLLDATRKDKSLRFGFSTPEHAIQWFGDIGLHGLAQQGFHLRAVPAMSGAEAIVDQDPVSVSTGQVAFVPHPSYKPGKSPIYDWRPHAAGTFEKKPFRNVLLPPDRPGHEWPEAPEGLYGPEHGRANLESLKQAATENLEWWHQRHPKMAKAMVGVDLPTDVDPELAPLLQNPSHPKLPEKTPYAPPPDPENYLTYESPLGHHVLSPEGNEQWFETPKLRDDYLAWHQTLREHPAGVRRVQASMENSDIGTTLPSGQVVDKTMVKSEEPLEKEVLDPNAGYRLTHQVFPDFRDGTIEVLAHDASGNQVGQAYLYFQSPNHLSPSNLFVHEAHRRKGIASAMYAHAEKVTKRLVVPARGQTADGKALWGGNAEAPQFGVKKSEVEHHAHGAVVVMAQDGFGRTLWGRRRKDDKYTMPAGHLDANEAPAAGAIRELYEEAGLVPGIMWFIGSFNGAEGVVYVYHAIAHGQPTIENDPDREMMSWEWHDCLLGPPAHVTANLAHHPDGIYRLMGWSGGK